MFAELDSMLPSDAGTAARDEVSPAAFPGAIMTQLNRDGRRVMFDQWDSNGNGGLSLAEIDRAIVADFTQCHNKPALMRAYKAADRDGNGFIGRGEFKKLLHFINYFNGLWMRFESVDPEGDRRLTMEEFGEACVLVGHGMSSDSELRSEFAAAGADGEVLFFEDFCSWCAHRHVGAGFADSDEEDIEGSAYYKMASAPLSDPATQAMAPRKGRDPPGLVARQGTGTHAVRKRASSPRSVFGGPRGSSPGNSRSARVSDGARSARASDSPGRRNSPGTAAARGASPSPEPWRSSPTRSTSPSPGLGSSRSRRAGDDEKVSAQSARRKAVASPPRMASLPPSGVHKIRLEAAIAIREKEEQAIAAIKKANQEAREARQAEAKTRTRRRPEPRHSEGPHVGQLVQQPGPPQPAASGTRHP
jgi:hypothetical protein